MAFSAIEKDGAMVVVEDSAATDENGLDCMCWRQAFKCLTDAAVDFWAHAADVPEDGGIWNQDMDDGSKCFLYWGPIVLCKPDDATLGDLDGIDYIDECDGYRQALRCEDDSAVDDRWILASASDERIFKEDDECRYWGGPVPCLPAGATLGGAPSVFFNTCEDCEEVVVPDCPACFGGRTPVSFTITLDSITACNLCTISNNIATGGPISGVTLTLPYVDTITNSGTFCRYYLTGVSSAIRFRLYAGGGCTGGTTFDTSLMTVSILLRLLSGVATYTIAVGPDDGSGLLGSEYFTKQGSLPSGWCEDDIGGSNAKTTCSFTDSFTHAIGGTGVATPNF